MMQLKLSLKTILNKAKMRAEKSKNNNLEITGQSVHDKIPVLNENSDLIIEEKAETALAATGDKASIDFFGQTVSKVEPSGDIAKSKRSNTEAIIYTDEFGYKKALDSYQDAVRDLNQLIIEFKKVFLNTEFTQADFLALKTFNSQHFRTKYVGLIQAETSNFQMVSLQLNEKEALKKVIPFIQRIDGFANTHHYLRAHGYSIANIRLINERAVFDSNDEAELKAKFSIDKSNPKIAAVLKQFSNLNSAFDQLYSTLKNNPSLGFNPAQLSLIGPYGLLYCDEEDYHRLKINLDKLVLTGF